MLIELMIVVAIIAILVSLAVPAYRDYIIRAKVTECIAMSASAKMSISEYFSSFSYWPPSITGAGIASAGGNVSEFCTVYGYNNNQGDFYIDTDATTVGVPGRVIRPVLARHWQQVETSTGCAPMAPRPPMRLSFCLRAAAATIFSNSMPVFPGPAGNHLVRHRFGSLLPVRFVVGDVYRKPDCRRQVQRSLYSNFNP